MNFATAGNFDDAELDVGKAFTDPELSLTITALSKTATCEWSTRACDARGWSKRWRPRNWPAPAVPRSQAKTAETQPLEAFQGASYRGCS